MSRKPPEEPTTPSRFPNTPPPRHGDDLFSVYETILSLNTSMAQLTERVGNLVEASRSHGQKLDKVSSDLHEVKTEVHGAKVGFKVGVTIVSIVVAGSVSFIAWLITKVLPAVLAK